MIVLMSDCVILESEFLAKPAVIKNTAVFLFLIGEHLLSKPLEHAHYALFVLIFCC